MCPRRFRKQQVLGSNPSVGSSDLITSAGLRAGVLVVWRAADSHTDSHAIQGALRGGPTTEGLRRRAAGPSRQRWMVRSFGMEPPRRWSPGGPNVLLTV